MTEALGQGGDSDQESDGPWPWDIPEEDAVSDQTTSPPPLEGEDLSDDGESTGLLPGQSGWVRRRQGWGRLGERGDSLTLNKAIASWNKENLEGSHLVPGTIARLDTTIKDLDSFRLGAGRVRTTRDLGDSLNVTCANLHFDQQVTDPAELMEGTAGCLKLSLSYPNLSHLVLQVRDIRVCNMGDGRSVNLHVSDGVHRTWRCWISDDILGKDTSGMKKGSIIYAMPCSFSCASALSSRLSRYSQGEGRSWGNQPPWMVT
jgi:hypothetical protein